MWLTRALALAICLSGLACAASELCYVVDSELYLTDRAADLMNVPRLSPEMARQGNQLLLDALRQKDRLGPVGISFQDARQIYLELATHPVASLGAIRRYDPEGCWGFCMGRALTAKLLADRMGVPPENTLKIWAVGTIATREGKTFHGHVATLVKAKEGGWYVLDTELGTVATPDRWYHQIQNVNPSGDVQLRLSRGSRLGPSAKLRLEDLTRGGATGPYFRELIASFIELQPPSATSPTRLVVPD